MADASAMSSPCALRSARGEALVGHFFHCRSDIDAAVAAAPATSLPSTGSASAVCALLVHGLMSDRTVPILSAVGHALSAHITCFAFDFPGQGGSEGFFEYGGYQHQVDDVQAVIEWLRVEHGLRVVALIGHSMGGNVVLLHAAQHHVVPLVVNLSGRHHLERGIIQPSKAADVTEFDGPDGAFTLRRKGKAFRITKVSIAERLRTSMRVCVDIAASTRVLTVHGDADEIIPHSDSADLHALLTGASSETAAAGVADARHTFLTVAGSDHGYSRPEYAAAAVQHVRGWLLPRLSALRGAQQ